MSQSLDPRCPQVQLWADAEERGDLQPPVPRHPPADKGGKGGGGGIFGAGGKGGKGLRDSGLDLFGGKGGAHESDGHRDPCL